MHYGRGVTVSPGVKTGQYPVKSPFRSKSAESYLSGEDVASYREAMRKFKSKTPSKGIDRGIRLEAQVRGKRKTKARTTLTRLKRIASSRTLVESQQAAASISKPKPIVASAFADAGLLGS